MLRFTIRSGAASPPALRVTLLLFALLLTACGGAGGGSTGGVSISGKLLVWMGDGESPAQRSANATTQVAYITGAGAVEKLLDVDGGAAGVIPCGNEAASANSQHFTFFVNVPQAGVDGGILYQITNADAPRRIGEAHAVTCLGNGAFQYAPDGRRLGYIDYRGFSETADFAAGTLRVLDSSSLQSQASFENVTAFQLTNTHAYFISLFTSGGTQAREAGVQVWNSGSSASEISTLYADEGCRLTSGEITATSSERLAVVVGQRCASGTSWQFYLVNLTDGTSSRVADGRLNTSYATSARTNNLFPAGSDASTLYFTIPDGLALNTTRIVAVSVDNVTLDNAVIDRAAVMPRYTARTFTLGRDAGPVFSPDGRWLAVAVAHSTVNPVVALLNLADPSQPPIRITAGDRGLGIPYMAFSRDSRTLYYLVGGGDGRDNTLFALDTQSTTERRLLRGRFGSGAVAPDGRSIALMQWQQSDEARPRTYIDLAVVATSGDNPQAQTLFSGLVRAEDGTVTGRRWAYPLAWR